MGTLTPNTTYSMFGVLINEKIIPDGMVWQNAAKAKNAGFKVGEPYKKGQRLSNNTGKIKSVTIHTTNNLAGVQDDAEQYTRATYNENMGSARVHFYINEQGAWQNLRAGTGLCSADPIGSAEVSWHAGDGSSSDGGNMTSISLEIILGDAAEKDTKSKDNGARMAAWLLWKNGLDMDSLVTHTYWVNKNIGNILNGVDEQCTTFVSGRKWCPSYIFASNNHITALANWKAFKKQVEKYLQELDGVSTNIAEIVTTFSENTVKVGDLVSLAPGSVYFDGKNIPSWVKKQNWYIQSVSGVRAVLGSNESKTNNICSPVHIRYLKVLNAPAENVTATNYLVKVTADTLDIRKGPGNNYKKSGTIIDRGVYTIVKESTDRNWGQLKSGVGWIALKNTRRI